MVSKKKVKIAVIGIGYVGLSISILLAQNNKVVAYDTNKLKTRLLNKKISLYFDLLINEYLNSANLELDATNDFLEAIDDAEFVIIATPTDYDESKNFFNTTSVDSVVNKVLSINRKTTIIIKSTIPVGHTKYLRKKFNYEKIIFSPEFLREDKALYDNLHPSRIIIGDNSTEAIKFASLLVEGALKKDVAIIHTDSNEAEAIKLFANTYLALRVSFFNELDSFAEINLLNSKQIIDGVCLDPRIGMYYNNPSFGYGGYCLPKDTKQLLANYENVPQNIISAVIEANRTRKEHIIKMIIKRSNPSIVGIYRLTMKSNSENFRQSAILDIISGLIKNGIKVIIFEPKYINIEFMGCEIIKDFDKFKEISDVVIANRINSDLAEIVHKVYSRDIYGND